MTTEEKQLLLKDLCARLPYGVILDNGVKLRRIDTLTKIISGSGSDRKLEHIRPYLRPMSSMTEEEYAEFEILDSGRTDREWERKLSLYDWLNAHHFDFRNLIGKGLAIDCTNLNIY